MFIGEGAPTSQDNSSLPEEGSQSPGPAFGLTKSLMAARRLDLLSFIPLLAIVALVALVTSFVRIVPRSDDERTRAKLATDALWVEPTLRFQLAVDEDMLVRLAVDVASGTTLQITPCDRTTALLAAIVALAAFAVVALLILQRNARQGRTTAG